MADKSELKVAVCDDESSDQKKICEYLEKYADENNLVFSIDIFNSGESLLQCDTVNYQLVFMDVCMANINGIETVKELITRNPKVQVVFGSTSREYAVDAYQLEAFHYLLKPFSYEQFEKVVDKFMSCFSVVRTIPVKVGRLKDDIYIDDLIWIEANGKRAILHTFNGIMEVSNTLAELENALPLLEFYRPIRWAVISLKNIKVLTIDKIIMRDDTEIPISRGEREKIKSVYAEYRWNNMRKKMRDE